MRKFLLFLTILALGAAVLFYAKLQSDWSADGPLAEAQAVIIPEGSSQTAAARLLAERGVLGDDVERFILLSRLFGEAAPIRAGEFEFPARVSAAGVLDILQNAQPVQRWITIPEGLPAVLVHERLMEADFLTGSVEVPKEGSVLPNTYDYERNETRAAVLARMQAAMTETLAELWAKRSPDAVVRTPEEAVILAAIVEKETGTAEERPMVAGVYTNRLKLGMKLQADPTIFYLKTKGRPLGRRILQSEIDEVNGYNTYSMTGLPAGPITNPGRESIAAVLNPAETDALYFVADGTGGHAFARTLAEHNANVAKWYAIRRERGEMD
ncbi:endolytic transglycosylase MltG [Pacificimonas sp. WHA3]|uniref:Endolytic murein transglycosylase n=1 Tax=Pacificimonas pallii TaxID=2827236 RepID=A0ABS6SDQ1_9SPHN|nr:endolytic transglycosylase MltG [Pacificimonas pallii]MBV7256504.1 endolytic transglycosylase MltG [Pacificimonas pallii]